MKMRILFVGLVIILAGTIHAQPHIHKHQAPCATMEQDSLNRLRFPQRPTLDEFEEKIENRVAELEREVRNGRTKDLVITIPIVVHVVHNGENVGTGTNISQAQIQAQIEVLNEDFRKKAGTPGENSNPVGADIEIEFCLSTVDEAGNTLPEPGIHRYNGKQADWSRDEIENSLKPNTSWNPNVFYNIWTVKFDAGSSNLIGYAQFPDDSGLSGLQEKGGPASTDGVVVRYNSFGSVTKGTFPAMQAPYNRGRTLTHETGHWLGLRHIWGDGNCANDFVGDTPPASGPSSGCPVGRISCGGVNMVQNYMDYSDDACMNIFTEGQKTRMRAVMDISPRRKSLLQNNLCGIIVADKPIPNFKKDKTECILLGSEVTFTDLSSNFPTKWLWTFEGGIPSTSTLQNPKVIYNSADTFDVTLVVENALGKADTIFKDYVTVSQEGICSNFTNFLPGYTPAVLPLSDFTDGTGFLTGHNSLASQAFSEYFENKCGYQWINGAAIRFSQLTGSLPEDAKLFITVWNARGSQTSPGSVVERKEVYLKQIQEDIVNNRPTQIIFDRETPLFARPYHVGVEILYSQGYSLAIKSSANGEATNATSWIKKQNGTWELFTIALGANIALDIEVHVGVNPSLQVAASQQLIFPGEEVTLNGTGASIFTWNATDGSITNVLGPQLVVKPTATTTYITSGTGLDLCVSEVLTTIYVREQGFVGIEDKNAFSSLEMYPNPGRVALEVFFESLYIGEVKIDILSAIGQPVQQSIAAYKSEEGFHESIQTSSFPNGLYFIKIKAGQSVTVKKWVKE